MTVNRYNYGSLTETTLSEGVCQTVICVEKAKLSLGGNKTSIKRDHLLVFGNLPLKVNRKDRGGRPSHYTVCQTSYSF